MKFGLFLSVLFLSFSSLIIPLNLWGSDDSKKDKEVVSSSKDIWIAHIVRRKNIDIIPFLEFPKMIVPIMLVPKDGVLQPTIQLKGLLKLNQWSLIIDGNVILQANDKRDFNIHLFVYGRINEFRVTAIGPQGEHITERVFIFVPQAKEFLKVSPWNAIMLSGGLAAFGYYQSNFGVYKALVSALTIKYVPLEGESPWLWSGQLNMTLQTFSSTPVRRGPQLIEGKFNGTYRLPQAYDLRMSEQIIFGMNYLTMISNDSPFGFENLLAPEFGWRFRWKNDNFTYYVGDFRFLTLGNNILKQRGIEFSGAINWNLKNMHNVELGIRYSGFTYQATPAIEVKTDYISLNLGYSL